MTVDRETKVRDAADASLTGGSAADWIKVLHASMSAALSRLHVMPGVDHPEEETVVKALADHGDDAAAFFAAIVMSTESWRGDLLRLIARVPEELTRAWGIPLAGTALNDPDADVREAAISALEIWSGAEAKIKLEVHQDPQQWLSELAQRVAREIP